MNNTISQIDLFSNDKAIPPMVVLTGGGIEKDHKPKLQYCYLASVGKDWIIEKKDGARFILPNAIELFKEAYPEIDTSSATYAEDVNSFCKNNHKLCVPLVYAIMVYPLEGLVGYNVPSAHLTFRQAEDDLRRFFSFNELCKVQITMGFRDGLEYTLQSTYSRQEVLSFENPFSLELTYLKALQYAAERSIFKAEREQAKVMLDRYHLTAKANPLLQVAQ